MMSGKSISITHQIVDDPIALVHIAILCWLSLGLADTCHNLALLTLVLNYDALALVYLAFFTDFYLL